MDEKIFDRCLKACTRSSRIFTGLLIVSGVVIYLQNKKIDELNTTIATLKQTTGDQTLNA